MDIPQRCLEIRVKVEGELAAASTSEARAALLSRALYQVSDEVLAALGRPGKSERYLKGEAAALDLLVFLCLPLVRGAQGSHEVASLLVEVAEGTADPVLQQKLYSYRRQILEQGGGGEARGAASARSIRWYLGGAGAALLLFGILCAAPDRRPQMVAPAGEGGTRAAAAAKVPHPPSSTVRHDSAGAPADPPPPQREIVVNAPVPADPVRGEEITRVQVVANQVLVPVTVKNGGESVKATFLLDTGSTRTALLEQFAGKLGIDLAKAKGSLVEVADGRVLHAKLARVEKVSVGAREVTSLEVEFYPYNGSNPGFDGFLGMDFLRRQRYQLDVEHEVIRWF